MTAIIYSGIVITVIFNVQKLMCKVCKGTLTFLNFTELLSLICKQKLGSSGSVLSDKHLKSIKLRVFFNMYCCYGNLFCHNEWSLFDSPIIGHTYVTLIPIVTSLYNCWKVKETVASPWLHLVNLTTHLLKPGPPRQ